MTTLQEHLDHLHQFADNFVTHWMEDDGNDAEDKARCQEAHRKNASAHSALTKALRALTTRPDDPLADAEERRDFAEQMEEDEFNRIA